jgi:hypothetical protein
VSPKWRISPAPHAYRRLASAAIVRA